jgi:hypothetical protein
LVSWLPMIILLIMPNNIYLSLLLLFRKKLQRLRKGPDSRPPAGRPIGRRRSVQSFRAHGSAPMQRVTCGAGTDLRELILRNAVHVNWPGDVARKLTRHSNKPAQNSALPGVRGNGITSRIFFIPVRYIIMRSNPMPKPACFTPPKRRRSRYHQ